MGAHLNSIDWEELFKVCPHDVDGQYNILTKEIQESIHFWWISREQTTDKVPLSSDVRKASGRKTELINVAWNSRLEIHLSIER